MLRGFQLAFEVGDEPGNEETEHVAAWVECEKRNRNFELCFLRRRVQHRRVGQPESEAREPITIAEIYDTKGGSRLLREFLYLWTRDRPGDERVRPQLQQNLEQLQGRKDRERDRDGLASATIYMYDTEHGEVLRYMGVVSTRADLRQVILELPTDCIIFEIHLQVSGRIIGNAEYRVEHDLDPATGKRKSIFSAEYGLCEGMLHIFADLYLQVDPTVDELLSDN